MRGLDILEIGGALPAELTIDQLVLILPVSKNGLLGTVMSQFTNHV